MLFIPIRITLWMSFRLRVVFFYRSKPVVNDILGTGLGTNNAIREEREVK